VKRGRSRSKLIGGAAALALALGAHGALAQSSEPIPPVEPLDDWTVGFGRIDPPERPELSLPATYRALTTAWGSPSGCEFYSCSSRRPDVAFYNDLRLTVRKSSSVHLIEAYGHRWRTEAGAKPRIPRARLRAIYGKTLQPVRNRHQLAGKRFPGVPKRSVIDRTSYFVADGTWAIGFGMVGGRVQGIVFGARRAVVHDLALYGPI
jgi:hypothetical protein